MFAMGAGVKGGYFGRWPGLTKTSDADLLVTTDYRSVLNEVVTTRLGASTASVRVASMISIWISAARASMRRCRAARSSWGVAGASDI